MKDTPPSRASAMASLSPETDCMMALIMGMFISSGQASSPLMNQLKQNGIGVMFVSSEMPEVMGMSDRIIVMCDGRITGELSAEEATQDMILTKATQFEQKTAL